jgi:hypothetical protein
MLRLRQPSLLSPSTAAAVRQSSASDNGTTLVGDGSMGNTSGDTTLAAGNHGEAEDGAQKASNSTDAQSDDPTDHYVI